jgi:hypothetical protein
MDWRAGWSKKRMPGVTSRIGRRRSDSTEGRAFSRSKDDDTLSNEE